MGVLEGFRRGMALVQCANQTVTYGELLPLPDGEVKDTVRPNAGDLSRVQAAWCSLGQPFTAGGRRRSETFSPFQRASPFQTEILWCAITGAVH